jgi:uncharacterized membrane protein YedE/YeeE
MHDFTPIQSLIGGALIGASASILLLTHGKVAGISGLYGGALRGATSDRAMRVWFLIGLAAAGLFARLAFPSVFATTLSASIPVALIAGILVGFGTQLGNGCTSGHGVCGLSRMSKRSFVATVAFMAAGVLTVFIVRHVVGGGS